MNNKKNSIFFLILILILLANCSFDTKTGIWTGKEEEKQRIAELKKEQIRKENREQMYVSKNIYSEEIVLSNKIT